MITIIHGSDTAASRKYLLEQKQQYTDAETLEPDAVNLSDLAQFFEGGGLFVEKKELFLEQFLTKRKKSGDYKDIITYLEKQTDEHMIILWENKELDISTLKAFKNPVIKAFKLPQTLFLFLDTLRPGNGKQLVKLYQQTISSTEPEMVFFMLIRQLRLLLALHPEQTSNRHSGKPKAHPESLKANLENERDSGQARMTLGDIDEVKKLSWQKEKLTKQANAFEYTELLHLYQKLYALESGQKTGKLAVPLSNAIDFLLLDV